MYTRKLNHWLAIIIFLAGLVLGHGTSAAAELPAYFKAKSAVNVRTEPNAKSSKVVTLQKGNSVLIKSVQLSPGEPDWGRCTVEWLDKEGWVCMDYMEFDRPGPWRYNERGMTKWQKVLLHTAQFFGYKQKNVWWFYLCFLLAAAALFIASAIEDMPYLHLLFQLIAMAAVAWYCIGVDGELMWQAEWEKVGWWAILGVGMYWLFARVLWNTVKNAAFAVRWIRVRPLVGILNIIVCAAWAYLLFRFAADFFMEHSGWALLLLLALMPKSKSTPENSIYVQGEGTVSGQMYNDGKTFRSDDGNIYLYDGVDWYRRD